MRDNRTTHRYTGGEVIDMRDIGKNIKELRQLKNMTQDELAEKLFVTRQTVSNYETGKSRPDIEMLTRIAETLETDPNTVLYGIPQQEGRKREILRLCISVALLVIAVVGYAHLADLARELAHWQYDQRLSMACLLLAPPVLSFLLGWTAMQALGVFTKLSPLKAPWCRCLRWIVLGTTVVYLLIILPFFLSYVLWVDIPDYLPDFLSYAQFYVFHWLIGLLPLNAIFKPNALIFGILGCTLWLGIPQKRTE